MAEEKKTPEKAKKNWFMKLIDWFASLPGRIAAAFKNMAAELRKVTWPSRKKLISSSITVLLFMLFTGVIVGLLDVGSAALINGVYSIGHPTTATSNPYEETEIPAEHDHDHDGEEAGAETTEGTEAVEATEPAEGTEVVEGTEEVETTEGAEPTNETDAPAE